MNPIIKTEVIRDLFKTVTDYKLNELLSKSERFTNGIDLWYNGLKKSRRNELCRMFNINNKLLNFCFNHYERQMILAWASEVVSKFNAYRYLNNSIYGKSTL